MTRIAKDPEARRNEILDAAMELFRSKGYAHTSVSDIVKKVGVAQGTFYYYFKSKEEIATAAHERSLANRLQFVKAVSADDTLSALDKLRKIFTEGFAAPEHDQAILAYFHDETNALLHQKFLVAKIMAFTPLICDIVEQGRAEGVFQLEHPREVTEFLLVGISFLFDPALFAWSKEELRQKLKALEKTIDMLLGGQGIITLDMFLNRLTHK